MRTFKFLGALLCASPLAFSQAQGANSTALQLSPVSGQITQAIDNSQRVTLGGNTRPEANAANDRGIVADSLMLEHMQLQLRLPDANERQLEQFIDQLHSPGSPSFHQWLTPEQFKKQFGVASEDIQTITGWLQAQGFIVGTIYPRSIDFSGTAGQVRQAFRTEIHNLNVNGVKHIANMSDPQVPAALAPAVVGIVSLHNFGPHPQLKLRPNYTANIGPQQYELVVPADLATIYNLNPLFAAGISGQGQTIVVIEDSDPYYVPRSTWSSPSTDWTTFRSTFGLSGYSGTFALIHPAPPGGSNCTDPGPVGGYGEPGPRDEATVDAEWASAAAPSAAIEVAACADSSVTWGGLIALQNLINASGTPPAIVSNSWGDCEGIVGAAANLSYYLAYQQAVTEGVSVFVSAGDTGAAACEPLLSRNMAGRRIMTWPELMSAVWLRLHTM